MVAIAPMPKPSTPPMPQGIGDGDLVVRALSGDRRAEDALYRRHARRVAGLVARLLGSLDEVEDIVHDAFVAAFEQLDKLREPEAFRSWLQRIAVIKVRRAIRRRALRRRLGFMLEQPLTLDSLAAPDASPEIRAELASMNTVLSRLSAEHRIAWMLRYVEGYKLSEVAELTGCSLSTAKRRIWTTHKRLREVVDLPDAPVALQIAEEEGAHEQE